MKKRRVNLGFEPREHRERGGDHAEAVIDLLFPAPPRDCDKRLERLLLARAHVAAVDVHSAGGRTVSSERMKGARRLLEREIRSFNRSCMVQHK